MFNNFNLTDDEIIKIINDYQPLIKSNSNINFEFDEDLKQEIEMRIFETLSKNRTK